MKRFTIRVSYGDGLAEDMLISASTQTAAVREAVRVAALHAREVAQINKEPARQIVGAQVVETSAARIACPTTPDAMGLGMVGCGSTNVEGPDDEGLYDCLDCGLFFTFQEAARLEVAS